MKMLFWIFATLATLYAGLLVFALFFSESVIFHKVTPSYGLSEDIVFLELPDDVKIAARRLTPKGGSKICVIYSHGNGEDLGRIAETIEGYRARGFAVLAYEYPGYGLSGGKASVAGMEAAAEAAWNFTSKVMGCTPENIALAGYSLGSYPACLTASKHPDARCIVLIGGLSHGVKSILPWNMVPWKILPNADLLRNSQVPLLLLHGTRDMVVPPRNARENFSAAKAQKKLVWFKGYGHYHLPEDPLYWDEVAPFINNPKNEKR